MMELVSEGWADSETGVKYPYCDLLAELPAVISEDSGYIVVL